MSCLLIVEDHALVREGMAQTLGRLGAEWRVIEAPDANAALASMDREGEIDLVVTDLMLPGISGFSLLAMLRERDPSLPVVVVSALCDKTTVSRAMRQGASGFVSKGDSGDQLVQAVRTVLAGGLYVPPDRRAPAARAGRTAAAPVPDAAAAYGLTQAQSRVLALLVEGRSNREIAEGLGLAEGTVKVHVTRILKALKVSSRTQVLVAVSQGRARRDGSR
ncbi:MAG: response regulator transcription factor [Gammaproteobacteria bacterium]|nr:response regulator transcription factor [Gammaproteobacteria bacterium]MBU0770141.1 response regulator transcription factor [Gammaproteobacteria bacterium]MBU0855361.1 response regulator transcription factor [Gammaproteobacteria bacterium]MBU1845928.1 response regulator transcription factor [Gammaproteobacteria bacterium]